LTGIPVSFTSFNPIFTDFTIDYTINTVGQTPIVFSNPLGPFTVPTPITGDYKLTGFTYHDGAAVLNASADSRSTRFLNSGK
jgi:hypothetical protein